jgi:hypothetical protein
MIVSQFQPRSANICAICALAKFKSVWKILTKCI